MHLELHSIYISKEWPKQSIIILSMLTLICIAYDTLKLSGCKKWKPKWQLFFLPWTLVTGWGQLAEVWSRYCWAGVLKLIYPCCPCGCWMMNQERQSHTVIPDYRMHRLLPLFKPPSSLWEWRFGFGVFLMSVTQQSSPSGSQWHADNFKLVKMGETHRVE